MFSGNSGLPLKAFLGDPIVSHITLSREPELVKSTLGVTDFRILQYVKASRFQAARGRGHLFRYDAIGKHVVQIIS